MRKCLKGTPSPSVAATMQPIMRTSYGYRPQDWEPLKVLLLEQPRWKGTVRPRGDHVQKFHCLYGDNNVSRYSSRIDGKIYYKRRTNKRYLFNGASSKRPREKLPSIGRSYLRGSSHILMIVRLPFFLVNLWP